MPDSTDTQNAVEANSRAAVDHTVIVIGAGVCGIYQLYRLLDLGVDVTVPLPVPAGVTVTR